MKKVKVSELKLGDIIRLFDGPYSDATVVNLYADGVKVIRPFIHTSDFTVSGPSVLHYIGTETVTLYYTSLAEVTLIESDSTLDKRVVYEREQQEKINKLEQEKKELTAKLGRLQELANKLEKELFPKG